MILKSQDVITVISKDGINYLNGGKEKRERKKETEMPVDRLFFISLHM